MKGITTGNVMENRDGGVDRFWIGKLDPKEGEKGYRILSSSFITTMAENNQKSGEEGKLDITPPSHSESDERLIPITPATSKKGSRQTTGSHTPFLKQEISKLQDLMIQQEQAHQEKADLVKELRSRIAELEASDNPVPNFDVWCKLLILQQA